MLNVAFIATPTGKLLIISSQLLCFRSFHAMQHPFVLPQPHGLQIILVSLALNGWLSVQCAHTPPNDISPPTLNVTGFGCPATVRTISFGAPGKVQNEVKVVGAFPLSVCALNRTEFRPSVITVAAKVRAMANRRVFIVSSLLFV